MRGLFPSRSEQGRGILARGDAPLIVTASGRPAMLEAVENNWYEASRWSPNRSWVWYPVQDARKDLDRFTRYELSKHARYLYKNSPLIRGLVERLVTLTVGTGLYPVFKSSNADWNKRAQTAWKRKCRNPHLGPRCSMLLYQRAVARARFLDGECFSVKTQDETIAFEAKLQGIESDRVTGGTGGSESEKTAGSVDGILLNRQGIPIAYKMRGVEQPYPADSIIHHFSPVRLGQYRGETILASAINTARDIDDILALEKQCVKDASSKQDIIKTKTGELDQETFRKLRYNEQYPTVFNLPADDATKENYYRVKFGAQPVVLKTGDEYTPYIPDRPGSAWQGFMDFLSNTVCMSSGMPPSILLPVDVGGTDIRRDLEIAQRVVEAWQLDLAIEFDEALQYLMLPDIEDGPLYDAPDDWTNVAWHFPQKINVDRAMAQQDRADVAAGLMSLEEYHGRYGDDGDAYDQTVIAEVKRRRDRIIAAGFKDVLEFVQVMSLAANLFTSRVTEQITPQQQDLNNNPANPNPREPARPRRGAKTTEPANP